jgi:hypothetical protein
MSNNSKLFKQGKGSASVGGRAKGYAIGYGKPPLHSRFRPGHSGNPAGRPKAVRNLMTDVQRTLKVPVSVKEGGRSRRISTQEGALLVLREKALKGDARALDRLIELASRFNNESGETSTPVLSAEDQAMLAAYTAEIAATAVAESKPADLPVRERIRLKPRASLRNLLNE